MVKKKKSDNKNILNKDSKLFAFLATFLSIIGFIIVLISKKEDKYVMFYAKQSLVLFITAFFVSIINSILLFIPFLGRLIMILSNVLIAILWVLSWVNALSGKMKEIPIIGEFVKKINL